ncbi:MAG TPA: DUF4912 domain-containing protein [Candidatus Methylomirabilis sp.]|nr:DUF4912 domain-containing protein [Candidatus Methylomirabilis sp.]
MASPKSRRKIPAPAPETLDTLRRLPRTELLALARRKGLKGRSRLKKEELVLALGAFLGIAPARETTPLAPAPRDPEAAHLPDTYGKNRLVLLPIDPYRVYAYWEVAAQAPRVRRGRSGDASGEAPRILRVYDVTAILFDGSNAHSSFDIEITSQARSWYVNLWSPGKSLCAELGVVRRDGRFSPLVRSNVIQTPPAWISPNAEERWIGVEWAQEIPIPPPAPSPIQAGKPVPQPGHPPRPTPIPGRPGLPPKEAIRAEAYRRFLEGAHRVRILLTDEPAPPAVAPPPVEEPDTIFDPGLSSILLVRKAEGD